MLNPSTIVPTTSVNVAVVGLGFMGLSHLRAYFENPLAKVVAVCGATRLPVNGILSGVVGNIQSTSDIQLGPEVKIFKSLQDLLAEPEIQLVDLCTPTPLHSEQAIAALKAGKHVLCEKPTARTSIEAREILKVAAISPGFLMPAMCMRFWPGWSWLKQVVVAETFGKVLAASFCRMSAMPAWNPKSTDSVKNVLGGALFDLHIHDTDFINYLFGRPESVFSTGVSGTNGEINHVVTQYHYRNGPAVCAEGSWLLAQGFKMAYTFHCERATLDYDSTRGVDALIVTESGKLPLTVKLENTDGYALEIDYILHCVANLQTPKTVTTEDGVVALEICEAEERSIQTGAVVIL